MARKYYILDIGDDAVDFAKESDAVGAAREEADGRGRTAIVYTSGERDRKYVYGAWMVDGELHETKNAKEIARKQEERQLGYSRSALEGAVRSWVVGKDVFIPDVHSVRLIAKDAGVLSKLEAAKSRAEREVLVPSLQHQLVKATAKQITHYGSPRSKTKQLIPQGSSAYVSLDERGERRSGNGHASPRRYGSSVRSYIPPGSSGIYTDGGESVREMSDMKLRSRHTQAWNLSNMHDLRVIENEAKRRGLPWKGFLHFE